MSDTQSYIQQNKQRFLDELIELLKIASISADQLTIKMCSIVLMLWQNTLPMQEQIK